MEDAVLVSTPEVQALSSLVGCSPDKMSATSVDSTFSIVDDKKLIPYDCYPSLQTALEDENTDGDIYEKRIDIKETKNLPDQLKKKLAFNEKEKIDEVLERVNARENLDQDIENEVKHLEDLQSNINDVDEVLVTAAEIAKQNIKDARKVASDGQTTVKRAMDIIELALPVFVEVWSKSQEKFKLNEAVLAENDAFEALRHSICEAGLDLEKRTQKTIETQERLRTVIKLAEIDVDRIVKKNEAERALNRVENCKTVKTEIDHIISNESEEVSQWLIECQSDKQELEKFQVEQLQRYENATQDHKKRQDQLYQKISLNRTQQAELRKKLFKLEEDEKKMENEKTFQQEVQRRATKLHEEICREMQDRFDSISGIQSRADTSRKVVELMTTCSQKLISASIEAEEKYLEMLCGLEKEAKRTLRNVLAHDVIETQIKMENSSRNMEDCAENMKVFKVKWKEAVSRLANLVAEKNKESYEEYKKEYKREKAEKEKAEVLLKDVEQKLKMCDENLRQLGVQVIPIKELYELRLQELAQQNEITSGSLSLDSDMESEDEFNDAES